MCQFSGQLGKWLSMQKFYKHHIQEGKDKGGELEEDIGAKAVE